MRAALATLALFASAVLAVPSVLAEEGLGLGPFDEECDGPLAIGCTWCEGGPCGSRCHVYHGPVTGWGWGLGELFGLGLCIFIDCVPATGCPPGVDQVKVNLEGAGLA